MMFQFTTPSHRYNRLVAAVIFLVVYGKKISGMEDEYVSLAHHAMNGLNKVSVPGAYWIDYVPFAKYIPSWLPGTTAKKDAEECLSWVTAMKEKPYGEVKAAIVSSRTVPSSNTC